MMYQARTAAYASHALGQPRGKNVQQRCGGGDGTRTIKGCMCGVPAFVVSFSIHFYIYIYIL